MLLKLLEVHPKLSMRARLMTRVDKRDTVGCKLVQVAEGPRTVANSVCTEGWDPIRVCSALREDTKRQCHPVSPCESHTVQLKLRERVRGDLTRLRLT